MKTMRLKQKITLYASVLAVFSIIISLFTSYILSEITISDKYDSINKLLNGAAVERTNTVLGEIAELTNLAVRNDNLNIILNDSSSTKYQRTMANVNYQKYLRQLLIKNDMLDAVIVSYKNGSILAASRQNSNNGITLAYKPFNDPSFFDAFGSNHNMNVDSQFFLSIYEEESEKRIAITSPLHFSFGNNTQAYFTVILSNSLSQQFRFAGDSIYLEDNTGSKAYVIEKSDGAKETGNMTLQGDLCFKGWKLISTYHINVSDDFEELLYVIGLGGAAYLAVVLLLAERTGRRLTIPINKLKNHLDEVRNNNFPENIIKPSVKGIGFRPTLLALFSLIVAVPVICISGSFFLKSKNLIESKIGSVLEYNTNLQADHMDLIFQDYFRVLKNLITSDSVQHFISKADPGNIDTNDKNDVTDFILEQQMMNTSIMNISLYSKNKDVLFSAIYNNSLMTKTDVEDDLNYVKANYGNPLWRFEEKNYFNKTTFRIGMQVIGSMEETSGLGNFLGYALLDFNGDQIMQIMDTLNQNSDFTAIIDDQGSIVVSEGSEKFLTASFKGTDSADVNNKTITYIAGQEYLKFSRYLGTNGWTLIALFPINGYFRESNLILYTGLGVMFCLIVLCAFVSYGFSYAVSKSISTLAKTVAKVKKGDFQALLIRKSGDEIEELGNSFNDMIQKLNTLIDDKLKTEMIARDAEIKARYAELKAKEYELNLLQAQINPHFLYNTLKTVQYLVMDNDNKAIRMIKLLINLFRSGTYRGEKLVTLDEEIQHVKSYIEIQQIRFSGKFEVVYSIPQELLQQKMLKLTLQPIVENAIYHGLEMSPKSGLLTIDATVLNNRVRIRVCDNGMGMDAEKLKSINEQLIRDIHPDNIGIINVHGRIRLFFGNEYGIEISSQLGLGTEVSLWIPSIAAAADENG
jgi:two-component system sensor histidine kinase YesM